MWMMVIMPDIMFKKQYNIKVNKHILFVITPYESIKCGLKRTTIRVKPKKTGIYRAKSGSYYKPRIFDFLLEIYKVREISINDLTDTEIKVDVGLTDEQYNHLASQVDIKKWFLSMLNEVSSAKQRTGQEITLDTKLYLHYFRPIDKTGA